MHALKNKKKERNRKETAEVGNFVFPTCKTSGENWENTVEYANRVDQDETAHINSLLKKLKQENYK